MRGFRSFAIAAMLGLGALYVAGSAARAGTNPDLVTVGLELPFLVGQNQPSSLGDFNGKVGYAVFNVPGQKGDNFIRFESDMRFMQGVTRPRGARARRGEWVLT